VPIQLNGLLLLKEFPFFTLIAYRRTDEGQASLIKAFETGKGLEKDRSAVTKDLNIKSVNIL
jgi:hypothetical protein